ncbi:MAG TPA: hypothetical protein P5120_12200 [Spirochaetota bacterium]|nr:hypothetical protein [Spirochaetota bacterium]
MKNNISYICIILSIIIISSTAFSDGISIKNLSSELIPFSENRDPANDSLYNAFDFDSATSALFSDFSVQFNTPLTADEIKIVNGNNGKFKLYSRLRDIEITLYTINTADENKIKPVKKEKIRKTIKDNKRKKDTESKDTIDKQTPAGDKQPEKEPLKNDKEKKDSETESSGELTALFLNGELKPVTGILNNPLAEEPVNPVSSDSEILQEDNAVKEKTDIRDSGKTSPDKKKSAEKLIPANNKKPAAIKKTVTDKKKTSLPVVPAKKDASKKIKKRKTASKSAIKKENKPEKDDIPFIKMKGITVVENDSEGRVIINISLKDIPGEQSIKFGRKYTVTAMEFRKRDDSIYAGSYSVLPYFSGINFYNKGKRLIFAGLETQKREYEERFVKALDISISDKKFSAFNHDKEVTRIFFRKNGRIEFRDRYKCLNVNDSDCTSAAMPDMWMIRDGRLYMRYMKQWILWKYELEFTPEILNGSDSEPDSRQWIKLYYKNETGFSDNFLYLEKSNNQEWRWD